MSGKSGIGHHTKLDFGGQSPDIEDINSITQRYLTVALEDLSGKKAYNFEFKPVTGSIYDNPYPKRMLEENANGPYWVLAVSPGTYELTTVTFRINIDKEGYQFFDKDINTAPIERYIKRTVRITAAPKQIVYIGDYLADFRTNVLLLNKKQLYPFNQLNISLTDNFEAAKEAILSKADEESKEKLESYEMISGISGDGRL